MFTRQKVQKHSFGIEKLSDYSKISNSAAAHSYLEKQALLEHNTAIDRRVDEKEKRGKEQDSISQVTRHALNESQVLNVIDRIQKEGRLLVFKDIMFEMFSKSLLLDADFVISHEAHLRTFIGDYVDNNGGYSLLENAYRRTKSDYLKKVMAVCEATSGKVARRKLQEAKQNNLDSSAINFIMSDDEKGDLDKEKDNLNVDQLADQVKKKVLTVIKDEKARQQKEDELYADLASQAQDENSTVQEVSQKVLLKKIPVEESTLFNAIFRHAYKEAVKENTVSSGDDMSDDNRDDERNRDNSHVNLDMDDIKKDDKYAYTTNDIKQGYTVDDEIDQYENDDEDSLDDDTLSIDMDLILAESITKYTLMELAYTTKLEDYSFENTRNIIHKLLN